MNIFIVSCGMIIFLLTVFQASYGCSCFPSHPHTKFCKADFAIRGVVCGENIIKPPGGGIGSIAQQRKYTIKVLKSFKGTSKCRKGRKVSIYTNINGALCGVSLQQGKEYLITGSIDKNKKFHINICGSWVTLYKNLSKAQQFFLTTGLYEKDCRCGKKIKTCFSSSNECDGSSSLCTWRIGTEQGNCQVQNSRCACYGKGCKWQSGSYGKC